MSIIRSMKISYGENLVFCTHNEVGLNINIPYFQFTSMLLIALFLISCGTSLESREEVRPEGTTKPTLKWVYEETGGNFIGSAAIDSDGSIYFGTREGTVVALCSDGSLKWRTTIMVLFHLDEFLPDGRPEDLREAIPVGFNLDLIPYSIWTQGNGDEVPEFFERQAPSLSLDETVLYLGGGIGGTILALNTSNGKTI